MLDEVSTTLAGLRKALDATDAEGRVSRCLELARANKAWRLSADRRDRQGQTASQPGRQKKGSKLAASKSERERERETDRGCQGVAAP